jgi:nitroimidazol reductase NimA-like FMN-containing flavoprotein (pyridoxamine 5'-phosphate oxidase superfamily)
MAPRELKEMSPEECLALLHRAQVGRLVYQDDVGPIAVPVNYTMAGEDIVVRVAGGSKRAAMRQPTMAFEVDDIDEDGRTGWSVIARGVGQEVEMERVPALLRGMEGHTTPWVFGDHNVWLKITPLIVTGRRLGAPCMAATF